MIGPAPDGYSLSPLQYIHQGILHLLPNTVQEVHDETLRVILFCIDLSSQRKPNQGGDEGQ